MYVLSLGSCCNFGAAEKPQCASVQRKYALFKFAEPTDQWHAVPTTWNMHLLAWLLHLGHHFNMGTGLNNLTLSALLQQSCRVVCSLPSRLVLSLP